MEHAQRAVAGQSAGQFGVGYAGAIPTPQRTLADRLESAMSMIAAQSNRIEDTLAKVNGTPRTNTERSVGLGNLSEKAPTAPLAQTVEHAELLAKRLCDLASNLEQVA